MDIENSLLVSAFFKLQPETVFMCEKCFLQNVLDGFLIIKNSRDLNFSYTFAPIQFLFFDGN